MLIFETPDSRKGSKKVIEGKILKKVLPSIFLLTLITLGTVFAANINLNNGSVVEFGQGVTQATSCDNEITITPESSFLNANQAGSYAVTAIKFSGIDSSSAHCASKDFYIKAYYKNNSNPQNFIDSSDLIVVRDNGRGFAVDAIDGLVLLSSSNESFTLTLASSHTLLDAQQLQGFTVESKDHIYSVGSEGPGGGVVFYISSTPFTCGPNLGSMCNALEYPPTGVISTSVARWAPLEDASTEVGGGARATGIGGGYMNSESIVHQYTVIDGLDQGSYQAGVTRLYRGGDLSDWYMPSRDELFELYKYARSNHLSAPMAYGNSSSEVSATSNWGIYFPIADQVPSRTGSKRDTNPSCPIRSFLTAVGH